MKRKLKPHIYKSIIALGIIGLYTTAWAMAAGNTGLTVLGLTAVLIMGVVHINEEDKVKGTGDVK